MSESLQDIARSFREGHGVFGGSTPRLDSSDPDREGTFGLEVENYWSAITGWPLPDRAFKIAGDGGSDWILRSKIDRSIRRVNVTGSDVRKWSNWRTLNQQIKEHNVERADRFISIVKTSFGLEVAGFSTIEEVRTAIRKPSRQLRNANGDFYWNREIPYSKLHAINFEKLKEYEVI